mgnify:CR=1 FL=1
MKKQEKTQKTKERILTAALQEFGTKSYDTASINSICEIGKIPKGLIYHNFKGKDELYLLCVKKVMMNWWRLWKYRLLRFKMLRWLCKIFWWYGKNFSRKILSMQTFFSMQCYNHRSIWFKNLWNCVVGSMNILASAILLFWIVYL